MSDLYPLSQTAQEVQFALDAVISPDQTPTLDSDGLVTSGGVKAYVDGAVGDLAGKTVTTEATGIGNTDNDTSIPTSAAVKDYVDSGLSTIQTGWTTLLNSYENQINPAGYTRTNPCFLYVEVENRNSSASNATLTIECEGINFTSICTLLAQYRIHSMTHVVPANTNFKVSVSPSALWGTGSFVRIRVKDFSA